MRDDELIETICHLVHTFLIEETQQLDRLHANKERNDGGYKEHVVFLVRKIIKEVRKNHA